MHIPRKVFCSRFQNTKKKTQTQTRNEHRAHHKVKMCIHHRGMPSLLCCATYTKSYIKKDIFLTNEIFSKDFCISGTQKNVIWWRMCCMSVVALRNILSFKLCCVVMTELSWIWMCVRIFGLEFLKLDVYSVLGCCVRSKFQLWSDCRDGQDYFRVWFWYSKLESLLNCELWICVHL